MSDSFIGDHFQLLYDFPDSKQCRPRSGTHEFHTARCGPDLGQNYVAVWVVSIINKYTGTVHWRQEPMYSAEHWVWRWKQQISTHDECLCCTRLIQWNISNKSSNILPLPAPSFLFFHDPVFTLLHRLAFHIFETGPLKRAEVMKYKCTRCSLQCHESHATVKCDLPPVSQTRLRPSPRLQCKSELFLLKETCTNWS